MARVIEGELTAKGRRYGIVVSRFNELIGRKLLDGALDCLNRHEATDGGIDIIWVPGAFEIPLAAKKAAETGMYDAVICLGAVIRGGTPHFEYVASEAVKGIAQESLKSPIPVSFGVLTCDTIEQAIERAGTKAGNKGFEAAMAALEMANLFKGI